VRPFDPEAKGTVLGEGGGILVVESLHSAAGRGAAPYCEVAGFASTQSWCEDTVGIELDPDDEGVLAAVEFALADASMSPDEVDAIAPFGCGVPSVDHAEESAIRRIFGDRAARLPIITLVPNIGDCCAGAGAAALSVAAKCIREQKLPARINTTGALDLDANVAPARGAELRAVLVITPGMGGQNAAVVLKRMEG
jgi:3-oxoacyl-(acyl-carrier-protein) synthase